MNEKKVAIFVDGQNYWHTQRGLGWKADPGKLLDFCELFGTIVSAKYYTSTPNSLEQQLYHNFLVHRGYTLFTKPIKTFTDYELGRTTYKCDADADIVADMFALSSEYDLLILVSGDGDFEHAVHRLKEQGKDVKVISSQNNVAAELVRAVEGNFIDIISLRELLERDAVEKTEVA